MTGAAKEETKEGTTKEKLAYLKMKAPPRNLANIAPRAANWTKERPCLHSCLQHVPAKFVKKPLELGSPARPPQPTEQLG